jgi:hypothetical protein
MPVQNDGKRKFGAGAIAHSWEFLAGQQGVSGCGGLTTIPTAAKQGLESPKYIRKMVPSYDNLSHDLIINHENDAQRDLHSETKERLLGRGHGNTLIPAARKKPFVKTVGVEMGGGINFFELPNESRRYVVPNQDRYNRTHIHDIIREPEHPNQNRGMEARGDLSLITRKKRQPWTDDFTKRELEGGRDPIKKQHEIPETRFGQTEERKRQLQTTHEISRGLGGANPSAGLASERWQEGTLNRRALREATANAGDVHRESWNFLRHDIRPTAHNGEYETGVWTGRRDFRPTTAPPACNQTREFSAGPSESRADRLAKFSSTGTNILAGQVNQFCGGWSKNNNRGQSHQSP